MAVSSLKTVYLGLPIHPKLNYFPIKTSEISNDFSQFWVNILQNANLELDLISELLNWLDWEDKIDPN